MIATLAERLRERRLTDPWMHCPHCDGYAFLVGGLLMHEKPYVESGPATSWTEHFVYRCKADDCMRGWITSQQGNVHAFQALTMHEL